MSMNQFEVIDVVGDGAFGTVTKCRQKEDGKMVAIKKMKQKIATFEECLQLKEVKSLRMIIHPNVLKLHQIFRENDHLFLVFELLHGSLLQTINSHSGPFSDAEVRFIMSQLFEGLAFVHRKGFFHRDIKPENIMWGGQVLKIADFGLAREIRSRPPYTEYISTRWYRAPELVLRHDFYNSPVDVWAAGAIMAELYTMKPLFQGSSETDQLFKICSVLGTPGPNNWPMGVQLAAKLGLRLPQFTTTPFSTLIPNASPEAIDLLTKILRFDPSKRPSASQALQHPFFEGEQIPPPSLKGGAPVTASAAQPIEPEPVISQPLVCAPPEPTIAQPAQTNAARMTEDEAQPISLTSIDDILAGVTLGQPVKQAAVPQTKFLFQDLPDPDGIDDLLEGLL